MTTIIFDYEFKWTLCGDKAMYGYVFLHNCIKKWYQKIPKGKPIYFCDKCKTNNIDVINKQQKEVLRTNDNEWKNKDDEYEIMWDVSCVKTDKNGIVYIKGMNEKKKR